MDKYLIKLSDDELLDVSADDLLNMEADAEEFDGYYGWIVVKKLVMKKMFSDKLNVRSKPLC